MANAALLHKYIARNCSPSHRFHQWVLKPVLFAVCEVQSANLSLKILQVRVSILIRFEWVASRRFQIHRKEVKSRINSGHRPQRFVRCVRQPQLSPSKSGGSADVAAV